MNTFNRIRVTEWMNNYYYGSNNKPTRRTIINRLIKKTLPGSNESGEWVVFCDNAYRPVFEAIVTQELSKNRFVSNLLGGLEHGSQA